MKNFFKKQENIIIIIVSIIAFIVGCLAIGMVKTFLIIAIADILFFLPNILNKKKKKATKDINKKVGTKKTGNKKTQKKKILKIVLIVFLVLFILGVIAVSSFAFYIVSNAPKFNPDLLYKQESSIIYWPDGEILAKLGTEKREKITYDELPEVLIDAIIATEDSRFFQHNGFDLARFLKASVQQVLTRSGGGASTLTMQVVKNTFTSTEASGWDGIVRKFTDIYMSIYQVEKKYSKKEIIEFYVNAPFLGSGSYGVEQACQTYFGKSAKDINLAEAALIAGLFQAPGAYDPFIYPEKAEQRRNQVLYLMERHGYITKEERKIAESMSVESLLKTTSENGTKSNEWQVVIDTVTQEIETKTKLSPYTTPMEIYTTIDKDMQRHINSVMNGESFNWANDVVNGGIAVVDVNNGSIKAVGGGRDKSKERTFNTATQNTRQIGSTSKPLFDYGPGIEYENWSTYNLYADEPYHYSTGVGVSNWDRGYNGLMTMRTALGQSRNIPAIKAFQANTNSNIIKFTTSLGLHPEVNGNTIHEAHAIGGYSGETPLTMAAAYAAFSNGGYYIKPYSYSKIIYRNTGEVVETKVEKTRVMSEETAYMMTDLLKTSAQMGLGNQYYVNGITYGAKTGTSNFDDATISAMGYGPDAVNDLWVTGINPDYAMSVWYGYVKRDKQYVSNSYTIGHRLLWQAAARGIFTVNKDWNRPDGVVEVEIEKDSWPAKLPSEYTPGDLRMTELFKVGTEPDEVSDRFSKLSDVSNLTSSVSGNTLTLKWNAIATPNAISDDYLNQYFQSLYTDEGYRNNAINDRKNYNNNTLGTIVYKVYSKDNTGKLTYIKETDKNTINIQVSSTSPTTYVVKTSYTKFTANASDGVETKVKLDNVKKVLSAKLNNTKPYEIKVGSVYKEDAFKNTLTVLEDQVNVTDKATIKVEYLSGTTIVNKIDTSKVGTYTARYTITYNGNTTTLSRTINVVAATSTTTE